MEWIVALIAAITLPVLARIGLIHWRSAVLLVMVLMVFEGALRKWAFPGLQAYLYFVKDLLIMLAFGGFLLARTPPSAHQPLLSSLTLLLMISGLYFFVHVAHPNIPAILIGVLGLKNYMLYAVLAYMVPYVFHSNADLERKLTVYMILMIPVAALGLLQFSLPPDHFLNVYVQHDDTEMQIATFGGTTEEARVRASGTFSYIGGYATFVTAMFLLSFACAIGARPASGMAIVAYILLALTVMATFTTGSRAVFFMTLMMTPPILVLMVSRGAVSMVAAVRIAVAASVIGGLTSLFASDAIDAFSTRATTSDSNIDRLLSPFTETLEALNAVPFFGVGIGTTHAAAGTIMASGSWTNAWWLQNLFFEAELARVAVEVGLPGFMLVVSTRIALLALALRLTYGLRSRLFKAIGSTICVYIALQLVSNLINNPTAGLYYWFAIGLLLALYRLEHEQANDVPRSRPQAWHQPGIEREQGRSAAGPRANTSAN